MLMLVSGRPVPLRTRVKEAFVGIEGTPRAAKHRTGIVLRRADDLMLEPLDKADLEIKVVA